MRGRGRTGTAAVGTRQQLLMVVLGSRDSKCAPRYLELDRADVPKAVPAYQCKLPVRLVLRAYERRLAEEDLPFRKVLLCSSHTVLVQCNSRDMLAR